MDLFRRRRPEEASRAIEDGRLQEDRLIGQELVPVPAPPMREVEVTRTVEAVTYREEVEVRNEEGDPRDTSPELIQDFGSAGDVQPSMERPLATTTFQGGELVRSQEARGLREGQSGSKAAGAVEEPMSPIVPEALWPGGPQQQVPPVYGPPLFSFDQLRKLQELYASAPQIYGQPATMEVRRPQFLETEETTLRARLKEIEDEKIQEKMKESEKSVQEEENRALKEMMMKMKEENDQLRKLVGSLASAEGTRETTAAHQQQRQSFARRRTTRVRRRYMPSL